VAVPAIPLAAVQGAKGAYLSIGRRGGTDMSIEAMKLMVHELEYVLDCINKDKIPFDGDDFHEALRLGRQAIEQAEKQEPVTILPDGSAFGVMSFPLPSDHWLYAPNEYRDGEFEPIDLPKPILTHALRDAVVAAVRYAVRGATMRGQETDFDPDALVQNAVYALCGPYTTPQPQREWVGLTDADIEQEFGFIDELLRDCVYRTEAKLKEKNT